MAKESDRDFERFVAARGPRLLPVRQRTVVMLRYFEDLSVEQTAAILGCRPGTVKSQSVKALRVLRERLSATGQWSMERRDECV